LAVLVDWAVTAIIQLMALLVAIQYLVLSHLTVVVLARRHETLAVRLAVMVVRVVALVQVTAQQAVALVQPIKVLLAATFQVQL
jgi:hypothetical protein